MHYTMVTRTLIAGSYQTDFARKWSTEGGDPLFRMLHEAADGALKSSGIEAEEIEAIHVGNFAGEKFEDQGHLGSMAVSLKPAWYGLPSSRHEAACASGSIAVLAAIAELQAGFRDVVLVLGVESMRAAGGAQAARNLGSAAWVSREVQEDVLPWPALFDRIAEEVDFRYGLKNDHLAQISFNNRSNALKNPMAQTRDWVLDENQFRHGQPDNPYICGRIAKNDCGLVTDGAAGLVLISERFARRYPGRFTETVAIEGWGHSTAPLSLDEKLEASRGAEYLFPNVRRAITDAYGKAGIAGPESLSAIETHDCFAITEYAVLDHFGLTAPGESWRAVEDGTIQLSGSTPVNPSGGLLGLGHPVGATGVRMLHSARTQILGSAGDTQVEGARRVGTLNIGGSASTAVAFVIGALSA